MTKINSHLSIIFIVLASLPMLVGIDNLRDPTRPPNTNNEVVNTQPINLNAVFIHDNYRAAVINGQTYFVGDHFNEYIITMILPDAVELTGSDNSHEELRIAAPVKN